MKFVESGKCLFTKAFDFKSRASRSEFWWGFLVAVIATEYANLLFERILGFWGGEAAYWVLVLPLTSLNVRRLHDLNKSAW